MIFLYYYFLLKNKIVFTLHFFAAFHDTWTEDFVFIDTGHALLPNCIINIHYHKYISENFKKSEHYYRQRMGYKIFNATTSRNIYI